MGLYFLQCGNKQQARAIIAAKTGGHAQTCTKTMFMPLN